MNKKVFTLLLVAVFMLAQFSTASATAEPGATTALAALPAFHNAGDVSLDWSVTGMDGIGTQNVFLWARATPSLHTDWDDDANFCWGPFNVNGLASANGTYLFHTDDTADDDQDVVDFMVTVSDQATCALAFADTAAADPAQASTFIDAVPLNGFRANPPYLDTGGVFNNNPVSCNTFEMWTLASDAIGFTSDEGYSGFDVWNQSITGTFAPPAPEGPQSELLSWVYTFPSTASGPWSFSIDPKDKAGNGWLFGLSTFRNALAIVTPDELEDCADFTDTAGHADELYIRYLADLELIAGNLDGTYGPDTTLTRAEAATLFEKANGVTDADPGFGTPPAAGSACDFSDVSAADWFAGWVWQACADGFMNGIGGGLFDPSNLLTRGQIVTVMNNIVVNGFGVPGSYLNAGLILGDFSTTLNDIWGDTGWATGTGYLREGAWTDVMIGAYYAVPVVNAYGAGVAEGTSDTTFSPDQAVLRGEFARMLYRALSRAED